MRYLLDTNAISNMIRFPDGNAASRVARLRGGDLGTSIVVSAELKYGYLRKGSKRLESVVEGLLAGLEIAAWDKPADRAYAELRSDLEDRGKTIGQNDMLIAAHALALNVVLVTDNVREFSRVLGLRVENWLRN
jgi:tRNA(fMet)-specific endonuclease VapC